MFKTKVNSNGGDYEKCPTGSMAGRLAAIIDLGHQWQDGFQGKPGDWQHRLLFVWQTDEPNASKGGFHYIAKDLTFSLNKKAKLRAWVQARLGRSIDDGEEYDLTEELGQACLLTVIGKNGHPNLESITKLPAKMVAPDLDHPALALSLAQVNEGAEIPDWVPWLYGREIRDVVANAKENGGTPNSQFAIAPKSKSEPAGHGTPPPPPPPEDDEEADNAEFDPLTASYWMVDAKGVTRLFTGNQVVDDITNRDLDPNRVKVCLQGEQQWRTAQSFGLMSGIPF